MPKIDSPTAWQQPVELGGSLKGVIILTLKPSIYRDAQYMKSNFVHYVMSFKPATCQIRAVFETVLNALVDIWSTIELTFGGPVLIVVDQRNMQ